MHQNNNFYRRILIITFAAVIPLIFFFQGGQAKKTAFTPLIVGYQWCVKTVHFAGNDFFNLGQHYTNLLSVKRQNKQYRKTLIELSKQNLRNKEFLKENERLRSLLNFKKQSTFELVSAKVIGFDANTDFRSVIIDKGSRHGLEAGMGVLNLKGVIGTLFEVFQETSTVLLAEDRYSVIDAMTQDSRIRVLLSGDDKKTLLSTPFDSALKPMEGELVITSGYSKSFPKGIFIGKVGTVKKDRHKISSTFLVKSEIHSNQLEEVFVTFNPLEIPTHDALKDETSSLQTPDPSHKKILHAGASQE